MDLMLHPRQTEAYTTAATEVLYGGAVGGGKSHLMRVALISWCIAIPGLQCYLFRRTSGDLGKNHLEGPSGFRALLAEWTQKGHVKFNEQNGHIGFWNGSKIFLCHCQYEKDKIKYQGAEIHVLCMDELTHFTESIYTYLRGRVRLGGLIVPEQYQGRFPRILCGSNPGGVGHCVPYGEVLTPNGWADIRTMSVGDAVYEVDDNGELVASTVAQVHRAVSPVITTTARGLHMAVTPEHRVAKMGGTRDNPGAHHALVPYKDLPGQARLMRSVGWTGTPIADVAIPRIAGLRKARTPQPESVSGHNWAALLGWFLTEGCLVHRDRAVAIAQSKPETRERLRKLLEDDCGFTCSWADKGVIIYAEGLYQVLAAYDFGLCRDKYIPRNILNSTRDELRAFFVAAVDGDGHWTTRGESGQYYTISERLRDDIQEVAVKLGFAVSAYSRKRDNREGVSYAVNFCRKPNGTEILTGNTIYAGAKGTKRSTAKDVSATPVPVYCIGTPKHHTFVLRQRGCVWVSGNSWVKATFVDYAAPMEIKQTPKAEGGMLRQYIPAKLSDNPTLMETDPNYIDRLEGLGNPALVRAMRDGDWDIVAGGAMDDVWCREKHVIPPFDIPSSWRIDRSFDWGSSHPFAVGWWAESDGTEATMPDGTKKCWPRGTLFYVAEFYGWNGKPNQGCRMLAVEVARRILEIERTIFRGRYVAPGPADSAIFSAENGMSIGDDMARAGVRWLHADKSPGSRKAGLEAVRKKLKAVLSTPMEEPGLLVFDTCQQFIRTVPVLPRDERNPDDVDSDAEDHIYDLVRYRCLVPRRVVTSSQSSAGW